MSRSSAPVRATGRRWRTAAWSIALLALLALVAGIGVAARRRSGRVPAAAPPVRSAGGPAGDPAAVAAAAPPGVHAPVEGADPATAGVGNPAAAAPARGAAATGAPAGEGAEPPAAASRPPRSRAGLVALLLTVLIAAGALLYTADRLARVAAETLLADEVQRVTGVFAVPEVEVHGPSFLLQAVRGRYDRVDISLTSISSGPLRVERVDAELFDVYVPLNAVLLQDAERIVVGHAEELAVLEYPDLNRYLAFTGRPFTVEPAGGEQVTITGEVQVLGEDYTPSVDARLGARNGSLAVSPTRLDTGTDLDRPAELLLGERFTFVVPLDPLPFGQRVTGIDALLGGIFLRAEGDDVVLRTD